jgi:hypothetical protein
MIEFRLRDRLKNDSGVSALVGDRVHPIRVPRMRMAPDSGDKVTYRRATGGRDHDLRAASGHPMPIFEIVCWSQSYDRSKSLAAAVRNCLDGFGPGTWGDVHVDSTLNRDEEDLFWEPEDGSETGWYATVLKYAIRYTESIPTPA